MAKLQINAVLLPREKFLQSDWLRAVVFQLHLKYLHVEITKPLRVIVFITSTLKSLAIRAI